MIGKQLFALLLLSLTRINNVRAQNKTCSLQDDGKSGDTKSAHLEVYNCVKATSSAELDCGKKFVSEVHLEKGKEVDVKYNVNGYAVMAKFIGTEVCISYREQEITTGTTTSTELECESECFCYMEYETYFKNITCSANGCDTHGKKKLKFVLHVSSGQSRFVATMGVLFGCAITTARLLF